MPFATISRAHLDGFSSLDSDLDLRGVHPLTQRTVVGMDDGDRTVENEGVYDGLEIDLDMHDAAKLFPLMLRRNGYSHTSRVTKTLGTLEGRRGDTGETKL